jgi:hypothetical protein
VKTIPRKFDSVFGVESNQPTHGSMWPSQARQDELRLETEKKEKYKGTARIRLEWLQFPSIKGWEPDKAKVNRLKHNFRKDCRRLDVRNHIPAVISQQDLDIALKLSGIVEGDLLGDAPNIYPELAFPAGYQLECLQGRHRIQAAKEALIVTDRWWVADLYLAGLLKP